MLKQFWNWLTSFMQFPDDMTDEEWLDSQW